MSIYRPLRQNPDRPGPEHAEPRASGSEPAEHGAPEPRAPGPEPAEPRASGPEPAEPRAPGYPSRAEGAPDSGPAAGSDQD